MSNLQVPEFAFHEAVPDVAAGTLLEEFCQWIAQRFDYRVWMSLTTDTLVDTVAEEFRRRFLLSVPVRPHLNGLLHRFDIAVVRHEEDAQAVSVDVAGAQGPWQIHQPEQLGMRQSYVTLYALFEILFWRCCHRVTWWNEWRQCAQIARPKRLAERFAYAVMLPAGELRARTQACHLDVWRLADEFQVTPSACFYGLRRFVRLPFPYFLARLNFAVELDQQQLFFEAGAVRAKVWAKFLARPAGAREDECSPLDGLQKFAKQGSVVEAKGFLYHAIRCRQPQIWTTRKILGLTLPAPIVFAARPNRSGTQLMLQAVPLANHAVLMDSALFMQQEQARAQQAVT